MILSRNGSRKLALESFVFAGMGLQKNRLSGITGGKCPHPPRYMLFLCSLTNFRITQSERREKETRKAPSDAFYNLFLEIPACSSGGYHLLCETSTSTSASTPPPPPLP